jgi:hypothetical protein
MSAVIYTLGSLYKITELDLQHVGRFLKMWQTARISYLKGQYHEIFDPLILLLNGTPGCPDFMAKAVLNIDSNSRRNSIQFDYEN